MSEDFEKYNGEGTTLRKAQLRLLEILKEVDKICKKHDITYWLDGGSALGAVRHEGFIPWDDDIDIAVLKRDYSRLIRILDRELPNMYALQNHKNEKYFDFMHTRVVDKFSLSDYGDNNKEYRRNMKYQGLFLDIFFIEKGNVRCKNIIESLHHRSFFHNRLTKNIIIRSIATITFPISRFIVASVRKINSLIFTDIYTFGFGIPFSREFNINEILPTKPIRFEGIEVMGPNDMHAYLKRYFGDYMKIPPKDKRVTHAEKIEVYKAKA